MNSPRLTCDIESPGIVETHGPGNRIPADSEPNPLAQVRIVPVVECIADIEKCGGGPFLENLSFDLDTRSYDVIRADVVVAQGLKPIAANAFAAACFEAVKVR